jgi:hypothetical protein
MPAPRNAGAREKTGIANGRRAEKRSLSLGLGFRVFGAMDVAGRRPADDNFPVRYEQDEPRSRWSFFVAGTCVSDPPAHVGTY